MGAENKSSLSFYSISNGKICKSVNQPTDKSVTRINKNNKTVHEEFFDQVRGRIVDIKTKEHPEFGKFWVVTLEDATGKFNLEMKYSSGYSGSFLKTLPNVDFTAEVLLIPKMTIEGEKKKTTLFITQHGQPLKHFYNKENPNGLPQLKQIKVKGKITWDDSEMMEFLENMVNTTILPKLSAEEVESKEMPF